MSIETNLFATSSSISYLMRMFHSMNLMCIKLYIFHDCKIEKSNNCWKCIIYCTAIDSIFHAIWPIFFHSRPDVISLAMLLSFEGKWKDLGFIIQEITRKSLMTIKETFNSVSMVFKKTDQLIFTRAKLKVLLHQYYHWIYQQFLFKTKREDWLYMCD